MTNVAISWSLCAAVVALTVVNWLADLPAAAAWILIATQLGLFMIQIRVLLQSRRAGVK